MKSFFVSETVGDLRARTEQRINYSASHPSPEIRALIKLKRSHPNYIDSCYYPEIINIVMDELRDKNDR